MDFLGFQYSDIPGLLFIVLAYCLFFMNMQRSKKLNTFLKNEFEKDSFPKGIKQGLSEFGFELYKEETDKIFFIKQKQSMHYWGIFGVLVTIAIISMPIFINISLFESLIFMLITLLIYGLISFTPSWILKKKTFYILNIKDKSFKKHIKKGS